MVRCARGSVIYLLPVLLAGWHLGLVPALVAAVAGVLWSGYFFFSPFYTFYLARPNEILNLLLFMVVAVVTSHLANSMKKQTEIARKREKEMGDLYAFSRRLAGVSSAADIYLAIEEHLASLVQRKVVLFGAGAGGNGDTTSDQDALSQRVHAGISDVQAGRTLAATVDDGAGDIWLVRRVSHKNADFGVIAIDLGSVPPVPSRRSVSGSTTCCRMPRPRSSGSMSRARSTTRRCAPRPSCCARR